MVRSLSLPTGPRSSHKAIAGALLGLCVFMGPLASLAADTTTPEPPVLAPHRWAADSPIAVDGRLEEPWWQVAPRVTEFRSLYPLRGPSLRTEAQLVATPEALHVAFHCADDHPERRVTWADDNREWTRFDDRVEVHLTVGGVASSYYQFVVNSHGTKRDVRGWSEEWEGAWDAATTDQAGGWQAELTIPWANFSLPADMSLQWGLNLVRAYTLRPDGTVLSWAPASSRADIPAEFGVLDLAGVDFSGYTIGVGLAPPQREAGNDVFLATARNASAEETGVSAQLIVEGPGGATEVERGLTMPARGQAKLTMPFESMAPGRYRARLLIREGRGGRLLAARCIAFPWLNAARSFEPTPDEEARGFAVFSRPCFERIPRDYVPLRSDVMGRLAISAVPGEYEPATFALHLLRDSGQIRLRPSGLIGPDGAEIGLDCLDLRAVAIVKKRSGKLSPDMLVKRLPSELAHQPSEEHLYSGLPSAPVTPDVTIEGLGAGATVQLWLTVRVPDEAAPGEYRGSVTITSRGGAITELPLSVRVLPIRLSDTGITYSIFFVSTLGSIYFDVSPEMLRKQLEDLRDHGLNAATLYEPVARGDAGDIQIDLGYADAHLAMRKQLGLIGPTAFAGFTKSPMRPLYFPTVLDEPSPEIVAPTQRAIRALDALCRDKGYPRILYYGADEPGYLRREGKRTVERCRSLLALMKEAGGDTAVCGKLLPLADAGAGGLLDVPIYDPAVGFPRAEAGQAPTALPQGSWIYWQTWLGEPLFNRTMYGLYPLAKGAAGVNPWVYQAFKGSAFDDFDGSATDMLVCYPSREGTIPTLQWEACREGIDDARYLATLAAMVEHARAAGHDAAAADAMAVSDRWQRRIHEDRTLLWASGWRTPVELVDAYDQRRFVGLTAADLAEMRAEVIGAILMLTGLEGVRGQ